MRTPNVSLEPIISPPHHPKRQILSSVNKACLAQVWAEAEVQRLSPSCLDVSHHVSSCSDSTKTRSSCSHIWLRQIVTVCMWVEECRSDWVSAWADDWVHTCGTNGNINTLIPLLKGVARFGQFIFPLIYFSFSVDHHRITGTAVESGCIGQCEVTWWDLAVQTEGSIYQQTSDEQSFSRNTFNVLSHVAKLKSKLAAASVQLWECV